MILIVCLSFDIRPPGWKAGMKVNNLDEVHYRKTDFSFAGMVFNRWVGLTDNLRDAAFR